MNVNACAVAFKTKHLNMKVNPSGSSQILEKIQKNWHQQGKKRRVNLNLIK
jgi:mRNA deadenylase 3'-5' endonuclease subunit Ccr4